MGTMGWTFVIFTTILLGVGVAFTVFWFRQAGARLEQARVRGEASEGEQKQL